MSEARMEHVGALGDYAVAYLILDMALRALGSNAGPANSGLGPSLMLCITIADECRNPGCPVARDILDGQSSDDG